MSLRNKLVVAGLVAAFPFASFAGGKVEVGFKGEGQIGTTDAETFNDSENGPDNERPFGDMEIYAEGDFYVKKPLATKNGLFAFEGLNIHVLVAKTINDIIEENGLNEESANEFITGVELLFTVADFEMRAGELDDIGAGAETSDNVQGTVLPIGVRQDAMAYDQRRLRGNVGVAISFRKYGERIGRLERNFFTTIGEKLVGGLQAVVVNPSTEATPSYGDDFGDAIDAEGYTFSWDNEIAKTNVRLYFANMSHESETLGSLQDESWGVALSRKFMNDRIIGAAEYQNSSDSQVSEIDEAYRASITGVLGKSRQNSVSLEWSDANVNENTDPDSAIRDLIGRSLSGVYQWRTKKNANGVSRHGVVTAIRRNLDEDTTTGTVNYSIRFGK